MAGRIRRRWTEGEKRTRKKSKKPSLDSTDDEEANEDMTAGIMEKTKLKKTVTEVEALKDADPPGSSAVINILPSDDIKVIGLAQTDELNGLSRKKKRRKKKGDDDGKEVHAASNTPTEDKKLEVLNSPEAMVGEATMSDNTVLRKLLRGPRYFDPPDASWGACYSCGEVGHSAAQCVLKKHKKPCHMCGKLGHTAHSCPEARTCFICKKPGHRSKKCLERHNAVKDDNSRICLRCGKLGHDMWTCRNDYDLDDLKEIRCYVCGQNGHLCCVDYVTSGLRVVSCYKCGQTGHSGLGCARDKNRKVSTLCYKCGEEGHLARGCNMFDQNGPRSAEMWTPQHLPPKDLGFMQFRSVPHDLGKSHGTPELLLHKNDAGFIAGNFMPVNLWRTGMESHLPINCWGPPAIATPIGPRYQVPSIIHSSITPTPWEQTYTSDASCSWNHGRCAMFADPNFSGPNSSNR